MSRQEAMVELKNLSGRRFDPEVVTVFESAWRDVEKFTRGSSTENTASVQSRERR